MDTRQQITKSALPVASGRLSGLSTYVWMLHGYGYSPWENPPGEEAFAKNQLARRLLNLVFFVSLYPQIKLISGSRLEASERAVLGICKAVSTFYPPCILVSTCLHPEFNLSGYK